MILQISFAHLESAAATCICVMTERSECFKDDEMRPFVIVAVSAASEASRAVAPAESGRRIQLLGCSRDKPSVKLDKIVDVVLRQNVTGGSGGTAISAMKGLPIVMTNRFCDASRWLGMDYSDIETYEGLMVEIQRLKSDKEYYIHRQDLVKALVSAAVDSDEKWNELFRLLVEAEEKWSAERE